MNRTVLRDYDQQFNPLSRCPEGCQPYLIRCTENGNILKQDNLTLLHRIRPSSTRDLVFGLTMRKVHGYGTAGGA